MIPLQNDIHGHVVGRLDPITLLAGKNGSKDDSSGLETMEFPNQFTTLLKKVAACFLA